MWRLNAQQLHAASPQQLGIAAQSALQAFVGIDPVALQTRQIDPPAHTSHEPLENNQVEEGVASFRDWDASCIHVLFALALGFSRRIRDTAALG